jgi:hypothetical protein
VMDLRQFGIPLVADGERAGGGIVLEGQLEGLFVVALVGAERGDDDFGVERMRGADKLDGEVFGRLYNNLRLMSCDRHALHGGSQ